MFFDKIVTRILSVHDLRVRRGCFSAVTAVRKMLISVLFLEAVLYLRENWNLFLCCLYKSSLLIIYLFSVILTFSLIVVIPFAIISVGDKIKENLIWAALELKCTHSCKVKTSTFYCLWLLNRNIQLLCVSVTLKIKQKDAKSISHLCLFLFMS